jgi:hypothetical protein
VKRRTWIQSLANGDGYGSSRSHPVGGRKVSMTGAYVKTCLGDTTPLDAVTFSPKDWIQVERKKVGNRRPRRSNSMEDFIKFTPAADGHGLWPWMNALTFGRDVAPLGR